MPIYEYSCHKCGEVIEKIQKFSDKPLRKHEGCGGVLTKLVSQSSFQLKGSGWYVTDYAGKGKEDKADAAPDPKTDQTKEADSSKDSGESKDDKKKEKKPAGESTKKKAS